MIVPVSESCCCSQIFVINSHKALIPFQIQIPPPTSTYLCSLGLSVTPWP